jgi:Rrf2 family protein
MAQGRRSLDIRRVLGMLSLTRRVDYGLIALADLCGSLIPISARDLAERHQVSYPLLANVLKELCSMGLVSSSRGKKGGYRLIADPAFVTVQQVIEALEGPFQLAACTGVDHAAGCEISSGCTIKWSVNKIHSAILKTLGSVTISDIVAEARVGASGVLIEKGSEKVGFHEVPLNMEV